MKRRRSPHFDKKQERKLYKSKKSSLLASGNFYKIRGPNEKRTTGHGQYKTFATLQVVENSGGGECLFLSVLDHLQHIKYSSLDQVITRSAMDVRLDIVEYVVEHWFDYAHGFFNYEDEFQESMFQYQCPEYENEKECKELYIEYMSQADTWGTHVELAAACKLYDFKCVLVTLEDRRSVTVTVMNDELDKREFRRTCFILFSGDLLAGHFRFLKPVGNVLPVPVGNYDRNRIGNVSTVTLVKKKPNTTTHASYDFGHVE